MPSLYCTRAKYYPGLDVTVHRYKLGRSCSNSNLLRPRVMWQWVNLNYTSRIIKNKLLSGQIIFIYWYSLNDRFQTTLSIYKLFFSLIFIQLVLLGRFSYSLTTDKKGRRKWFKQVSSIKKRNQSMSTSAFIVGLGLTEAILRIQA